SLGHRLNLLNLDAIGARLSFGRRSQFQAIFTWLLGDEAKPLYALRRPVKGSNLVPVRKNSSDVDADASLLDNAAHELPCLKRQFIEVCFVWSNLTLLWLTALQCHRFLTQHRRKEPCGNGAIHKVTPVIHEQRTKCFAVGPP